MFTRCWLLTLIWVASGAGQSDEGWIVGRVVDEAGYAVVGALVQLTREGAGAESFRAEASPGGDFALEHVRQGAYAVRISSPGFRVKRVHTTVSAGSAMNLKSVTLRVLDCDAPSMNCCCPSDTVLGKGLLIKKGCGADLASGRVVCEKAAQADFFFVAGDGAGLYVHPVNGALITPIDAETYGKKPVRIDGFGPGSDFWVRTARGRIYSHLILTADVDPDSEELNLWYVNRTQPRQPLTPSDAPCRIPSSAR